MALEPDCIYAIGDIHGCFDKLIGLEQAIIEDARGIEGSKLIIFLGDYIDRGPGSSAVIDHIMGPPPPGFMRAWICGNHEEMLLDALESRLPLNDWLFHGGDQTLLSYGYDVAYRSRLLRGRTSAVLSEIVDVIPARHRNFLGKLPISFATPSRLFVHAGVRPGLSFAHQSDHDLLRIRGDFLDGPDPKIGRLVIHGHSPSIRPVRTPWRIGVDTGAYMEGPLTAVRLSGDDVDFISYR